MTYMEKMVRVCHQTCKHFKQTIKMAEPLNITYCDECTKGHNLFNRTGENCDDYQLNKNPSEWGQFIIDYKEWSECMDCKYFKYKHRAGSPEVHMKCKKEVMFMDGWRCPHFIPKIRI